MTDDIAFASEDNTLTGGKAILLVIVTCGIYGIYWAYKMGKQLCIAKEKKGLTATDNSTLYLILQLANYVIGIGTIINYCLIQSELNEIAQA